QAAPGRNTEPIASRHARLFDKKSQAAAPQRTVKKTVPVRLQPSVTVSTNQMMEAAPVGPPPKTVVVHDREYRPAHMRQRAAATSVQRTTASEATTPSGQAQRKTAQTPGVVNFLGADFTNSHFYPPDTMGAA